ncbi:MAG: hypothetical protein OXL97_09375 [Chloroflexota bacterium]|nr:hypothetical protein [Chloroflexota bacterium]MDE2884551.1 hypothetical protein [Chloroflexota bacterium]
MAEELTISANGPIEVVAGDFTRYADDPVGFVTDVLGDAGAPYSKQAEMLEALVDHRRVSVVGANGSGKDWAAGRAVLWWLETRPESKALTLGPTQRQVEEVVWQEMREAYAASEGRLSGRMFRSAYRVDEQRFALGFSTNNALNIQGFHSEQLLVVVTEAHAMPQSHVDAIKRLQPDRLLLVGNALSRDGEFYASHHSKRNLYHRIAISAFDTPNFTGEDGGRRGMITPEDVEEYALDYGEDHPLYAASVLAQFPDALEDSLVGREAVESAMERWEQPSPPAPLPEGEGSQTHLSPGERSVHDSAAGEGSVSFRAEPSAPAEGGAEESLGAHPAEDERSPEGMLRAKARDSASGSAFSSAQHDTSHSHSSASLDMTRYTAGEVPASAGTTAPPDPNAPVYVGVDVARFGFDKSAVCVRQGQRVLSMRSFGRMDTMRLVHEVLNTVRESGAEAVFVDEGGVGGGVVDRLRELGAPVYGVHFGGAAQRQTRFFNRRSEIFWELRRLFDQRLIAIPRDEELAGQLLALRYDVSSSGQVRLEGKREMRKRGMPSPDKADALALAFLVPPSFGIWTGAEPFLRDDDPPAYPEPASAADDGDAGANRLGVWV